MARKCALEGCNGVIPDDAHPRAKYHDPKCRGAASQRRLYARRKIANRSLAEIVDLDGQLHPERARRGRAYEALRDHPEWVQAYREQAVTASGLAALADVPSPEIHQALAALAIDELEAKARRSWKGVSAEAKAALEDFKLFRERYFVVEDTGEPYVTTEFHLKWIRAIEQTMETKGRLMILSPPRHGKTALLLHFCLWLMMRNPNIRIVWIAGSKDLAEDWIASLQDELEHNEKLAADFLPPGKTFRPPRSSRRSWARSQFTIDTRTRVIKSPTMVASSRGAKILSRDADLIVADDVEDHGSTVQHSYREQTRKWWSTDVTSRKTKRTAQVVIGSRQHPDDLYGHLLESNVWDTIVETAHDENCPIPDVDIDAHVACMLWPEYNDFRWLMEQLAALETTGGRALWEMQYLNRPEVESLLMFNREKVLAARSVDHDLFRRPDGSILVAGLDPSGTGFQASFLWAWHAAERKLYMVDLENEEGGGIPKARAQVSRWFAGDETTGVPPLHCRLWFVEENLYHGGIVQDEILQRYAQDHLIQLEPHHTGSDKWDPYMGVSSINSWFEAGKIVLPYGSERARAKTDLYIRQLLGFASTQTGTRFRTHNADVVMASWFPFPHIQFLHDQATADVEFSYKASYRRLTSSGSKPMFTYRRKGRSA